LAARRQDATLCCGYSSPMLVSTPMPFPPRSPCSQGAAVCLRSTPQRAINWIRVCGSRRPPRPLCSLKCR